MRRRLHLPLEAIAPFRFEPEGPLQSPSSLDFAAIFGNSLPVEIEIGFGKGAFLVDSARSRPETNWFGLEVDRGLEMYVAGRLAKRNLINARVGCADAKPFLKTRVIDRAFAAAHVYFPDPWWKRRHRKRRIWTPDFIAELERAIQPGGRIFLATDVGEYYKVIRKLLDSREQLVLLEAEEEAGSKEMPSRVLTNFERKALIKGGKVWRAVYRRT